ncbi:MAG: DNA repair protein RecN, partial [Coleofasciculus sp. C2-GNP5-27]
IAAMADRHFRVDKQVIDQTLLPQTSPTNTLVDQGMAEIDLRTVIRVSRLDHHSHRQEEIAQLAGGQSGQEAMTFADSLLTQARHWRQN